ncbi:tryptophan--tRNA ligase, cytoplasmic-like [Mercenaria mercenaria]|uniref:tryptophan--tRNA ligase, cytoplasmic-like n=1 Tax=Mercenaria mercenaria TaxID=6596 RepID=UPI00234F63BE|nr:tryptophan--tRNA ligase, cytoplasmic-like [Mercenaria mercenaria]
MANKKAAVQDVVTPWEVTATSASGIDYDTLLKGKHYADCEKINDELIERIEDITGKPAHHFLRRGIVISHSMMNDILDLYQAGKPFYLYTGRGPSSESLHLGHLVPFQFTKWLQDTFDVPLVIQLTDDEKYLRKGISTPEEAVKLSRQNAKDIIAFGFDEKKTFIFSNFEYMCPPFYKNICRIEKLVTNGEVMNKFGIGKRDSIGKTSFPAIQAAPSFCSSFPEIFCGSKDIACLIPCALDQHIFFQVTREVAPFIIGKKPALIHATFLPALNGAKTKMSASDKNSAIFLTDREHEIEKKIQEVKVNDRVSSGMGPVYGKRENLESDISYQLAKFFFEDEMEWNEIKQDYETRRLSAMELKERLIIVLKKTVRKIQEERENVTDDIVTKFMSPRPLIYKYKNVM